jgi:hypothetical protein
MKTAEGKFSSVTKWEWAVGCMHVKKIYGEYLKLERAIDEMSEQFIVNLEMDSDDSSSDTESTNDGEMSTVDPLDS